MTSPKSSSNKTTPSSRAVSKEQCPECARHGRDRSEDNLVVYDDGHKYCYACEYFIRGDNLDGLPTDASFTYEYLPYRGINTDVFRKYGAKTKINSDGKPIEIGYPERNGSYHVRTLEQKGFYHKGDYKPGCFGMDKFVPGSHKHIIITEGYEDALSMYQVLRSVPVVSVHSSSSAVVDCSADRSALNEYERIYLAFDGDEQGSDAAIAVAKLFDYSKVYHIKFPGGLRKDANDFVRNGDGDTLLNLYNNAKKFLPQNIESELRVFKNILFETPKTGVSYGIPTLDYMTYGIRTGETVLLTAQEGVGKTEVMHKIEYTILKEQPDASVAAIFLEEPKKRHLQALAGIHLKRPVHLPDCGVDDAAIYEALQNLVRVDDRLHVYSHFGSDDPDHILDTIRFLVSGRGCKYVFLDHITMVVSGLGGDNERRALDYLSTRLEMLVKELDFALILVSHVNDDGLTRGSRNIAKVADVRIDLTRDLTSADPIVRRTTNVLVRKNRFCGRTGPAGQLLFDPATYTLNEDTGYDISAANDNRRIEEMAA